MAYRFYVSEALKTIAHNTALAAAPYGTGIEITKSYRDMVIDMETTKEDKERSEQQAGEIINRISGILSEFGKDG